MIVSLKQEMKPNNVIDPYLNIPKGLNNENLWKAFIKRIEEIDTIRRAIRSNLNLATAKNETLKIQELKAESIALLNERNALHNEMKLVKERIKQYNRLLNGQIPQPLAIEFMLIAQKKLPKSVFADIRDEAAIRIVSHKA